MQPPSEQPGRGRAASDQQVDVAVIGGGICGLTLAVQLRRYVPNATVCVVERTTHPVAEAAHKVGESSVEVQAQYLRSVLGLKEHLDHDQLRKFGLRMFFPFEGNHDIARRVEFGQIEEAPLPSYQLDRGRLENRLGEVARDYGVSFLDGSRVEHVEIADDPDGSHQLTVSGDHSTTVHARWVIDASGRAAFLKRKLGLARAVDHHSNAAWFRVDAEIDPSLWSADPGWQARVPSGLRRLSTNHLMGDGYWVWMIPLSSGATSIGIVAADQAHAHDQFNTRERALAWISEREPQLAETLRTHRSQLMDFRVMRDYAYSCTQVYDGSQRWCLTGEAGVSIDPLYSSGGDLMAISNGLITDLVQRDLAGEDVVDVAAGHNQIYLIMSEIWLIAYQHQYALMGNPRVMVTKVVWDTIIYWAVPGLLYFHDTYRRLAQSATALPALYRTWEIHDRVQRLFREWAVVDDEVTSDVFADPYSLLDFMVDLHTGMAADLEPAALEAQLWTNVALLERLAGQLATVVSQRLDDIGADTAVWAAWADDPLLQEFVGAFERGQTADPIDPAWISLGHRVQSMADVA